MLLPMRLTIVGTVIITLFMAAAFAQEKGKATPKFDAARLIGIWTMEEQPVVRVEFTKDGDQHVFAKLDDETTIGAKGKYKLVGDKLTVTAEYEGKTVVETYQVKVLTDDTLIYQVPEEKAPTKLIKKRTVVSKPVDPKTK